MDIGVGTKQAVTSLRFVTRREKLYLAGRVRGCELSTPTRMRIKYVVG
jgi:hypothetical protein